MSKPDLNLLYTLDVLLQEGSVVRAAQRLRLSPSAMSRALARLRETTGDPLLVRAGRGLVPTPRALELRDQVGLLVLGGEAALRPAAEPRLGELARTFTLRASDGFVESFGAALLERLVREAPGVRLRFVAKANKDGTPLREAAVDLEIGVVGKSTFPELRSQPLFRDRFAGVVRLGHPLSEETITPQSYAAGRHILVSRRGLDRGPVDEALERLGLERLIVAIVGGFPAALALARDSDLISTVPERCSGKLRAGMFSFALPVEVPEITLAMLWHPRQDADPALRWLRACVREICCVREIGRAEPGRPG